MKFLLTLAIISLLSIGCSGPEKSRETEKPKKVSEPKKTSAATTESEEDPEEDQYRLVLRHVDNRVVIYINDSTIFDTGEVRGGPYEREINLTEYLKLEKNDLKIELYNTNPPSETIRPGWMIVYDIFVNDDLVEFISEKKNESTLGVVFTETYDLSDLW